MFKVIIEHDRQGTSSYREVVTARSERHLERIKAQVRTRVQPGDSLIIRAQAV